MQGLPGSNPVRRRDEPAETLRARCTHGALPRAPRVGAKLWGGPWGSGVVPALLLLLCMTLAEQLPCLSFPERASRSPLGVRQGFGRGARVAPQLAANPVKQVGGRGCPMPLTAPLSRAAWVRSWGSWLPPRDTPSAPHRRTDGSPLGSPPVLPCLGRVPHMFFHPSPSALGPPLELGCSGPGPCCWVTLLTPRRGWGPLACPTPTT